MIAGNKYLLTDSTTLTRAEIDLAALDFNYQQIKKITAPDCRIMPVIKGDAYGHGAVALAHELQKKGVYGFAVSSLREAEILRQNGITCEILLMSCTLPGSVGRLAELGLTQTVLDEDYAVVLNDCAQKAGVTLKIHIKADTGLSRIGFSCSGNIEAAAKAIANVCKMSNLNAEGIYTHFAMSDEENGEAETRCQFSRLQEILIALKREKIDFKIKHCCASSSIMLYPQMHLDMIRPGLILYGLYPEQWLSLYLKLKPVMSLRTTVVQVKMVPAGTALGYGHLYVTDRPSVIATLPVGYADGYTRRLVGKAYVLIKGKPAYLRGGICMNYCLADVTDIEGVVPGTTATLFGMDNGEQLSVEQYAAWSDTINNEAVCEVQQHVPRIYIQG